MLQDAGFELGGVDERLWCIPTDCKRFPKKVAEEGFCYNRPCETCCKLFDDHRLETASAASTSSLCGARDPVAAALRIASYDIAPCRARCLVVLLGR